MYDRLTDVLAESLGGSVHVGYWDDAADPASVARATERLTDLVADRLAIAPGGHILDVGCGNGKPGLHIARRLDVRLTGITVSTHQLGLARAAVHTSDQDRVEFRLADATHSHFAPDTFDAAFAIESLLHMTERTTVLTELARVVRPGGRLVVADVLLRRPIEGDTRTVVDAITRLFEVVSVATEQEYRTQLGETGWDIREFVDIGENVRPVYRRMATAMRDLAASAPDDVRQQTLAGADLVEAFASLPEIGYVLITARRK
ncbi:SAM-dependent methyltransferase [Streptomyces uncialis]|uniref:SAM-dependent methyltransferase n=1 Tax=Streptomyces uncialis TaxID=1048205 RepID=UPI0033F6A40B